MKKWILGFMLLVLSLVVVQLGVAFAENTTIQTVNNPSAAQYKQITSMTGWLEKVAQTGEVCVVIKLMGQGTIANINVDYRNVPPYTNGGYFINHIHSHYYIDSRNIMVGKEETHRLRRNEDSFPKSGNNRYAYITATGQRTMQGGNWPLSMTYSWTPRVGNQSSIFGGLKSTRSAPTGP